MRIHRVRLRNYRGVIDDTVEFPAEGVTIIEGANERGKTSIPEAVDLILETLDSSRAKRVRDVRPVHRDEVPEVEIEVSTGAYRFTYRKRWLGRPHTGLEVTAPRPERFTGREAHDRVSGILDQTLDRELWRALRIEQLTGGARGSAMDVPALNVRSLVDALDVAVGGESTGEGEDNLWRRICDEREKYWTATGRVKQERSDSKRKVEESEEQVNDLNRRLQGIELDAARVDELRAEGARLSATRDEAGEKVRELEGRDAKAQRLRAEVELLDSVHREAMAGRDRIISEQRRRTDLVEARDSQRDGVAALEAEARRTAPVIAAAIARNEAAQTTLAEQHGALRAAEANYRGARRDHEHHRSLIDLEQLRERRQRTVAAQQRLSDAESSLQSARVDRELVDRIEVARLGVVRAEAALQSVGVRVQGTALSELTLSVDGVEMTFASGEEIGTTVAREMALSVPGVAELVVRAGAESRNLVTELNRAREEYHELCRSGGVSDLAGARRAVADRDRAERNRREAIAAMKRDLRDLTPEVLAEKIGELRRRTDRYAAERPSDPPLPATYDEAKQIAAGMKDLLAERRDEYGMRQAEARSAAAARESQELREATLAGQTRNARDALAEAERQLALAREERSDAELEEELRSAQGKVGDASAALVRARENLGAADPASIKILLDNERAAVRRAARELKENEEEERELRAGLKLRGEEGLFSRLGEAERRLRRAQREHRRLEARAAAAELLHSRFAARRQESQRRYHAPLTDRIEEFGRIVFGPGFSVELGDDLEVVRRTLGGVTLDVDHLSAGAREQLGLLSRLACAVMVSPDGGGAPVIIDDALGWSDPDRLARMGAAIGAAGRQCQIIILTCTPGRYARVGNAGVIRLSA